MASPECSLAADKLSSLAPRLRLPVLEMNQKSRPFFQAMSLDGSSSFQPSAGLKASNACKSPC